MREYHSVFTDTNMDGDQSNNISREDYKLGSALFAFDLTPDQGDSGHFNRIRTGNVDVEIHFGRASTSNHRTLFYMRNSITSWKSIKTENWRSTLRYERDRARRSAQEKYRG